MWRNGRHFAGTLSVTALALLPVATGGCGGEDVAGPEDTPAIAAELETALGIFTTVAFREVGRGVLYEAVLGGSGAEALERNAGTVFRWDLEEQRYEPSGEAGPADGVRFVLYAALEAVPAGAPLVETGSIDYAPAADGGTTALLRAETGATLELTFRGRVAPPDEAHEWRISGRASVGGESAELTSAADVTPDAQGTSVRLETWSGPAGLRITFSAETTGTTVFGGEDSEQRLVIVSQHGRVEMRGRTLGGTGTHVVSLAGREIAEIRQLSELSPDLIEAIVPTEGVSLGPQEMAALRQVFRVRNHLSTGVLRLVHPVLGA